MRLLIATDAFPPVCGGSGWSTYELARGLRARGHHIVIVQPQPSAPRPGAVYDGFAVTGFPAPAPPVPFVRNYLRNERLYARLAPFLADVAIRERIDLVHGQHLLTASAAVRAGRIAGIPSVCTVRDYWPVCYWGDLTKDADAGGQCPACSPGAMTACIRPHAGPAWPLALPWIPYMRANLAMKQRDLAGAHAIVAVSRRMAADLRERSPALAEARIETIPNAVDVSAVRAIAAGSPRPLPEPYALFVGKLAGNKGVSALVDVVARARLDMPLVVAGNGPERGRLLAAGSLASRDIRVLGWLDRDVVFQWMHHACLMIFPSGWQEPLSRVLIEASAIGVPVAAMDTGGTADIMLDEETGLLSASSVELAADVERLAADAGLRARLGRAARARAESLFDVPVVLDRMERLYEDTVAAFRARGQRAGGRCPPGRSLDARRCRSPWPRPGWRLQAGPCRRSLRARTTRRACPSSTRSSSGATVIPWPSTSATGATSRCSARSGRSRSGSSVR
jgi:glycogen synthase